MPLASQSGRSTVVSRSRGSRAVVQRHSQVVQEAPPAPPASRHPVRRDRGSVSRQKECRSPGSSSVILETLQPSSLICMPLLRESVCADALGMCPLLGERRSASVAEPRCPPSRRVRLRQALRRHPAEDGTVVFLQPSTARQSMSIARDPAALVQRHHHRRASPRSCG